MRNGCYLLPYGGIYRGFLAFVGDARQNSLRLSSLSTLSTLLYLRTYIRTTDLLLLRLSFTGDFVGACVVA